MEKSRLDELEGQVIMLNAQLQQILGLLKAVKQTEAAGPEKKKETILTDNKKNRGI